MLIVILLNAVSTSSSDIQTEHFCKYSYINISLITRLLHSLVSRKN